MMNISKRVCDICNAVIDEYTYNWYVLLRKNITVLNYWHKPQTEFHFCGRECFIKFADINRPPGRGE